VREALPRLFREGVGCVPAVRVWGMSVGFEGGVGCGFRRELQRLKFEREVGKFGEGGDVC
jgi:hypothetical protein